MKLNVIPNIGSGWYTSHHHDASIMLAIDRMIVLSMHTYLYIYVCIQYIGFMYMNKLL